MTTIVKVEKFGDDFVIKLPKEALTRLNAKVGETLEITEHPEGLAVNAYNAEYSRQMKVMRHVMEKHRDVLRMLSES